MSSIPGSDTHRRGTMRLLVALLTVMALVAGCSGGGDSKDDAKGKGDKKEAAADRKKGGKKDGGAAENEGDTSAAAAGEAGPEPTVTTVTTIPAPARTVPTIPEGEPSENPFGPPREQDGRPPEVTVRLASGCVVRGGTQTVTITSEPQTPVAYGTRYSDGEGQSPDGEAYGGSNIGHTGSNGKYTDTFTVSLKAPAGPVAVYAYASDRDGMGSGTGTFEVAGPLGTCD